MAGFKSPEEFDAWQLAWELKERVYAFTAKAPAVSDCKFCDEIRESARSAPDNISEGFYRFNPVDFANFVRIARGSLGEVRNQLRHARSEKYLNDAEFGEISHLCRRAIGARNGPSGLFVEPSERLQSPENQSEKSQSRPIEANGTSKTSSLIRTWNRNPELESEPREPDPSYAKVSASFSP